MAHYKDPQNNVHFLDSAEYEHLLPAGSVPITDEDAAALNHHEPTKDEINAPIYAQLNALDLKSIRALREGNAERIAALEAQAAELRGSLVT